MRKEKGFTLIELMVVIVIIAILAAVALPNFMGATEKARESAVTSAVKTLQTSLELYATDHNGEYTDNLEILEDGNYLPGGKYPNNPATNAPYSSIDDAIPEDVQYAITYSYDASTNGYTITGYNRDNTKPVITLSNH